MNNNENMSGSADYLRVRVQPEEDLISDHTRSYLDIVFYVVLQGVVTLCGCAFNVLNIVVFVKQ
ncbi:unnamed protein product, partial [Candidula unifasciata]